MLAMRAYELMVIFDGDLDDTTVDAEVARVGEQIAAKRGTVATTDRWGRRRFAYEIAHKHEGHYVVFEVIAGGGDLDDLERQLRLADNVVRHKLIRLPDREAARRGLAGDQAEPAAAG
jgi:small subunit ribosomal protein S6